MPLGPCFRRAKHCHLATRGEHSACTARHRGHDISPVTRGCTTA
jgi:hypothetical protein